MVHREIKDRLWYKKYLITGALLIIMAVYTESNTVINKTVESKYNYILDESSKYVTGKFIKDFKMDNTDNIVLVEEGNSVTSLEVNDSILYPLIHNGGRYEITEVIVKSTGDVSGIRVKADKTYPIWN